MGNDTVRLSVGRKQRIEDSKELKVIDKTLRVIQTVDCAHRVALPLHIDSPGQQIDGDLLTDRYYLSIYGDELVYLHEAVPLT